MTTCLEQPWTAWSLESLSPCTGTLYCLFIWKRCHGRKCVRGRNAAARTLLSHPTPAHPTPPPASGDDAMLSVAASVSEEGKQLPGRDYPTPPHPTPPHLETMPCWVWPQVCQRKERSCQDIIPPHPTPPPRIWRRCHVECGRKCVRGRNAAARMLLSHTPPHLGTIPCWVWPQVCQRKERSCQDVIIPPHPTHPQHLETMLCWLWPQLWRGCWFLSHADGGWWMAFFWLRNPLVLVAESPFLGCGIVFFWLRNRLFLVAESVLFWLRKRLFLVAEACLILVAESSKFGCGSVEIWFRNRTLSR